MPALPAVAKVVRLDLFFTVGVNTRVRDRMFFSFAGAGPTVTDLNTWLTTVSAAWGTNMSPQQHTSCTLTSLEATDLTSSNGAQTTLTASHAGTLTGTGTAPAAGIAVVIKFRISRRYRGGHPRFYMPGPSMGNLADSEHWTSAYATAIATAFAGFVTAAVTGPPANLGAMSHSNISYFLGFHNVTFPSGRQRAVPTLRALPVNDTVVSYAVNPIIASQRRRNQQSP
jgi:hypothetical protein